MKPVCFVLLFVSSVFGDTGEEVSVMEGKNVTLPIDDKQPNETMRWYFNDTLIALINGEPNTSCPYDGEGGIFRGRLEVDYETGSLTITDITTNHTGHYEAELIRGNSTGKSVPLNKTRKCDSTKINKKNGNRDDLIKTFNVNVNTTKPRVSKSVPGGPASCSVLLQLAPTHLPGSIYSSGLPPAAVAGIVVGVVLLVVIAVVGVMIYCHRSSRNDGVKANNKDDVL